MEKFSRKAYISALILAKVFNQLSVRSDNMEFLRFSFHPSSAYFSVISSSFILLYIILILTVIFLSCHGAFLLDQPVSVTHNYIDLLSELLTIL